VEDAQVDLSTKRALEKALTPFIEKAGGIDISLNSQSRFHQGGSGDPIVGALVREFHP